MNDIHALKDFTEHDLKKMSTPKRALTAELITYVLPVKPASYNCSDKLEQASHFMDSQYAIHITYKLRACMNTSASTTKSRSEMVTIGVLASICHREKTRSGVLELAVIYVRIWIYRCTTRFSTHKFSSAKRSPYMDYMNEQWITTARDKCKPFHPCHHHVLNVEIN